MKIPIILSQDRFEKQILPKIDSLKEDVFIISILDPDEKSPLREDSENYKTFYFYDIDYDIASYKCFSYEDAQEMYKYIKKHEGKQLITHCALGVARSAAVGEFYFEMQGGSYRELINNYPRILPNPVVLQNLRLAEKYDGKEITINK